MPTHLWDAFFVNPLAWVLQFLASFTGSGGAAIILMTLIVKTILLPLSLKQTASMKAMQSLQPEIAAIKKKHKERERVTQETMKLYKERGINPASGCVPMIPTMVVLIALYGALINLASCLPDRPDLIQCDPAFRQPFLWVHALNLPDLLFSIPDHNDPSQLVLGMLTIPGWTIPIPGLLPILMAVTQYFSSKMMTMPTDDPQQQTMNRMMTVIMPGMMLFWGVTFPAGLVLYWLVSNIFEMIRLYFTMGPATLLGGPLKFSSPFSKSEPPAPGGNGALPAEPVTSDRISGDGSRSNGRPNRPRQKRGRRSGRR